MIETRRTPRMPAWLWLWLPIAVLVAQVVLKATAEDVFDNWMHTELGIVQNLTVVFLLVAVVAALWLRRMRHLVAWRWFGAFCAVMAAGCFFFAGEEASWGQHWFGFSPPEVVAARNEQGEFNLHNDPLLETLLDQLPRNILTLAALIGGIIVPLRRRRRDETPDFQSAGPWGWIWPTAVCVPAAVLAVAVTLPSKLVDELPAALDIKAGETKEMCLALFLMLYLVVMLRELLPRAAKTPLPAP